MFHPQWTQTQTRNVGLQLALALCGSVRSPAYTHAHECTYIHMYVYLYSALVVAVVCDYIQIKLGYWTHVAAKDKIACVGENPSN